MNRREFILSGLATLGARLLGKLPKNEPSDCDGDECWQSLGVRTVVDYDAGHQEDVENLCEFELKVNYGQCDNGEWVDDCTIEDKGPYVEINNYGPSPIAKLFPDWWDMGVNGESIPINLMDVIECSLASPDYSIHHSDHEKREKVLEDWRKPTEVLQLEFPSLLARVPYEHLNECPDKYKYPESFWEYPLRNFKLSGIDMPDDYNIIYLGDGNVQITKMKTGEQSIRRLVSDDGETKRSCYVWEGKSSIRFLRVYGDTYIRA